MPSNRPVRLVYALVVAVALVLIGRNLYRRYVNNALVAAIKARDVSVVRSLLGRGADPNHQYTDAAPDVRSTSPQPVMSLALSKIAEDPPIGVDPLGSAAFRLGVPNAKAEEIVLLLLQHGAHWQHGYYLQWACSLGDLAITRELLQRGEDPNTPANSEALTSAINYAHNFGGLTPSMARTPEEKAELA